VEADVELCCLVRGAAAHHSLWTPGQWALQGHVMAALATPLLCRFIFPRVPSTTHPACS